MSASLGAPIAISPWWLGLVNDHIYETCPGRTRSLPELRKVGWDKRGLGALLLGADKNPDVCGWCQRVWRARNRGAS